MELLKVTQVIDKRTNLVFYICQKHFKRMFELIPTLEIIEEGESFCDVCEDRYNLKKYFNV